MSICTLLHPKKHSTPAAPTPRTIIANVTHHDARSRQSRCLSQGLSSFESFCESRDEGIGAFVLRGSAENDDSDPPCG